MRLKVIWFAITALFSLTALIAHVVNVQAQTIPREDCVYISDTFVYPPGWNPLLLPPSWGYSLMYDSLFIYSSRDDVWIPFLAESVSAPEELTLEITIRPGAEWWDGELLTAWDVKYTFDLASVYTVGWSAVWDYLSEVTVVNDATVQFKTTEDLLNRFELLNCLQVPIIPKHIWEPLVEQMGSGILSYRYDDPAEIVGSSCYRLHSWSADFIYYERVDDWWGVDVFGLPGPQYVCHKTHVDAEGASLSFETGQLDASGHNHAGIWEWEWCRTYYNNPPYYIGSYIVSLIPNYAKYPLNDINVRRAIAYAIPYDDVVTIAETNYTLRASPSLIFHHIPEYAKWINQTLVDQYSYGFDLARAAEILDEANIIDRDQNGVREMPDGTPLGKFTITVPMGWSNWMMTCDMLRENLDAIGFDVKTYFPDTLTFFFNMMRGEFDIAMGATSTTLSLGYSHPWNSFRSMMDPRITGPIGVMYPSGNWQRYNNSEVIPLLDLIPKETDEETLKQAYSQLQHFQLRDLPVIPLVYGQAWYSYREDYWVGWPNEDDPRWLSPYVWSFPNNKPMFFGLSKASEGIQPMPSWVTDLQIQTYEIFGPQLVGDINRDGIVDIFDVVILANAFGSKVGDPNWNPDADLNNDDIVDIFDVVTIATNFGATA